MDALKNTLIEAYLAEANLINQKYDYGYNKFHEGKAVFAILMRYNCDLNMLKEVIIENSLNTEDIIDEKYATDIVKRCEISKERYRIIDNYKDKINDQLSDIDEEKYCQCVAQLMHHTHIKEISGKDDIKIVSRLFGMGVDKAVIKNILTMLSPVSQMPGRNDNYPDIIVAQAIKEHNKKVDFAKKNFNNTHEVYLEKFDELQKQLLKKKELLNIEKNKIYYLGTIVKKLIKEGFYHKHIVGIIDEVLKEDERFKEKNNKYAYYIVSAVKRQISAEKAIINYIPFSDFSKMSYDELKNNNISMGDIYKKSIQDRIRQYPSTINELSEKHIDIDACVNIVNNYGSIIPTKQILPLLLTALNEFSPRAKMPGIEKDYIKNTIEKSVEKCRYAEKEHKKIELRYDNYKKECELIKSDAKQNYIYQDGRYAIQQLQNGMDKSEIVSTIAELSVMTMSLSEQNGFEYATEIINKAENYILQLDKVANFELNNENSISNSYMNYANQIFSEQGYLSAKNDVVIAGQLLQDAYSEGEIKNVIKECSPAAFEPGRSESYQDYVVNKAIQDMSQKINVQQTKEQNNEIGYGYSLEFSKEEKENK